MAQTYLSQEEMKALEQTRRGLSALANNIASLKQDLLRSNPLPQWSAAPCVP
jgi:mediator of RNA polymerase II transcription subunit 8